MKRFRQWIAESLALFGLSLFLWCLNPEDRQRMVKAMKAEFSSDTQKEIGG